MTRQLRGLTIGAGAIAALAALLGFSGVLDPVHAALFGCLLFAALGLRSAGFDHSQADWPTRRQVNRAGARNAVSDLAWQVFDTDRRVRGSVVKRVRELATARLALLGVDVADPAQWPEVERLLGAKTVAGLASDQPPTARALQTWLDAIDQLDPERTIR